MTRTNREPNQLIHATSPYLLQHAYNPVAWQEWSPAALEQAVSMDKPILVSIGYSSCHWCHVMERESFEQDDVARLMNDYFICVKVDREERPDIDQVYMEAVQAMGGHGGWPLNVFLTPDQKPFYGGTYFQKSAWVQLIRQIHATFNQKRSELDENANELAQHLAITDLQRFKKNSEESPFGLADLEKMFASIHNRFDPAWGGLEKAPKFVMPSIWLFLLRYHAITKDPDALEMVRFTLMKMQQGGLYDQLGGGFSRYSVDGRWFAPHFEKMLYDNAQLLSLYSEAYAVTKEPNFKRVVYDTIRWLTREMTHPEGGFYSALDADSEGIEGKFYTWTQEEIHEVLDAGSEAIDACYNVTAEGNWEHHRNILTDRSGVPPSPELQLSLDKLLDKRNTRVRPGLDDKILTGWNAMMIKGLVDASAVFEENAFLVLATNCIRFLESNLMDGRRFYRSFKDKRSNTEGFLEDYAFLIQAYTSLYQATFDEAWLRKAKKWCDYARANFLDVTEGYFHFTGNAAEPLIARKKEIFDNVIPGSNSVMAQNLHDLGTLFGIDEWKADAARMLSGLGGIILTEPAYLSNWGILLTHVIHGNAEVVFVGKNIQSKRKEFAKSFFPFALKLGAEKTSSLPLFEGRDATDERTWIYVCHDQTCQLPVESVDAAIQQLN